jgi:hypothetical protein
VSECLSKSQPADVGYGTKLQSGQDPGEDDEHIDELPGTVSDSLCRKIFGCAKRRFHQLSGWLVSDHPAGEEAGCGGPGLAWIHVVCGCEAGWTYCQIL